MTQCPRNALVVIETYHAAEAADHCLARSHDDYIDRLNAEVEKRLSYLQHAERSGPPVLIGDVRSMLNNTLERIRHTTDERTR
jgi:hypothetical protein